MSTVNPVARLSSLSVAVLAIACAVAARTSPPPSLPATGRDFWDVLAVVWGGLGLALLALLALRALTRLGGTLFLALSLLVGGAAATTTIALATRAGGSPTVAVAACWLVALAVAGVSTLSGRSGGGETA